MAEDYGFGILFCFSIFQCSAQPTSVELSPCSLLGSGSGHQHVSPKPQPELGQIPPCLPATGRQSESPTAGFPLGGIGKELTSSPLFLTKFKLQGTG